MPTLPSPDFSIPPAGVDDMLKVGEKIYASYFGEAALAWPVGTDLQAEATARLLASGYDRAEWVQAEDDILLCLLWFSYWEPSIYGARKLHREQWIIEFSGHDALVISVFQFAGERVL